MLEIKKHIVTIMHTNCYFIKDKISEHSIIIDPGASSDELDFDLNNCKKVEYILLTHGHFDHISAAIRYKKLTGAKIVIGNNEDEFTKNNQLNLSCRFRRYYINSFQSDILLHDNDKITFQSHYIQSIFTPGHTKGSVCYMLDRFIFSGDTLMNGNVGRCDLPTGNENDLKQSLNKLLKMDGDYVVYPGHGLSTTIKNEREKYLS